MHEAQLHDKNAFITLTYDDEHLPPGNSLRHRDWQLFAKRARKVLGPFKFYMCGEYGETFTRPHFHACLFGVDFDDKKPINRLASGSDLFESATLSALWKLGFASVGRVTFQSAAYVARYVMKKITGDLATPHYTYVDENGEIHERTPEYNQMSRGGRTGKGIAHGWISRHYQNVYSRDSVIVKGFQTRPPTYYDRFAEAHLDGMDKIRLARSQKLNRKDNTPRRLAVREQVKKAQLRQLKRTIK